MSVEPAESSGGYGSYRKLRDTHEAPPNRSSWFAGAKTESAIGHVDGSRAHRTSRENDADAAPELEPNGTSALPWVSQKITPLTATERPPNSAGSMTEELLQLEVQCCAVSARDS
jgi:hypothetical protein